MQTSESIANIGAALAAAQGKFPSVTKDRTAKIASQKGSYSYSYADLASVLEAVKPALAEAKIAHIQPVTNDGALVSARTRLIHASGEWIESDPVTVVAESTRPQSIGSAITYARRYSLCSILDIAAEEDDDGRTAQGDDEQQRSNGNGSNGKGKSGGAVKMPERRAAPAADPTAGRAPAAPVATITEVQASAFWEVARKAGKTDDQVRKKLVELGVQRTVEVPAEKFDDLCKWAVAK